MDELRSSIPDLFKSTVSIKRPKIDINNVDLSEVEPANQNKFMSDQKLDLGKTPRDSPEVEEPDDVPIFTQS